MSKIIKVPNIGVEKVEVIEVCVSVGDKVSADDSIFIGETDKVSMEIPIKVSGTIEEIYISVGDKVTPESKMVKISSSESEQEVTDLGNLGNLEGDKEEAKKEDLAPIGDYNEDASPLTHSVQPEETITPDEAPIIAEEPREPQIEINKSIDNNIDKWLPPVIPIGGENQDTAETYIYAGPSVRKLARKLGVDLTQVNSATGPRGRLTKNDIYDYVQANLNNQTSAALPQVGLPELNINKGDNVEEVVLSKIQQISAQNLQRNAMYIPHVTQFDKCDITDMNQFRKSVESEVFNEINAKLTVLPFIIKAVVHALKENPKLNASISNDVSTLYLKKYYNIGVAVNTPTGLLVPVVKDADKLSIKQIATELSRLTEKAKSGKLFPNEMSDATFTISSLGGVSGIGFTPIVNWPEVGILGISPAKIEALYNGSEFIPRLMLPLSLSYDHRAVDGVDAALFTKSVSAYLQDIRRMTL